METRNSPSLETLHRLARQVELQGYESMPKSKLFKELSERYNIDRLMRAEQRAEKKKKDVETERKRPLEEDEAQVQSSSSDKRTKSSSSSEIDPIMLCKISKKMKFEYKRPNGSTAYYNVESLIDYLISSGEFIDPQTRIPFSDEDLQAVDEKAKSIGLNKQSVVEAKRNVTTYSDAKFRRDALLAIERCAGELITDILEVAENYDPEDGQLQLVMHEFPAFTNLYRQMKDADPQYASKCLSHWKQFIKGPPNRPNYDEYGLLQEHVIIFSDVSS